MYMLSFLSIVGTAGNALVLYVFIQRKDKLVSTVYIISLAVVDFITCLVVIPFTVYMERIDFHVESDVACKVGTHVLRFARLASALSNAKTWQKYSPACSFSALRACRCAKRNVRATLAKLCGVKLKLD
jgi:7 transmembrane receptor (rhodopsin family)